MSRHSEWNHPDQHQTSIKPMDQKNEDAQADSNSEQANSNSEDAITVVKLKCYFSVILLRNATAIVIAGTSSFLARAAPTIGKARFS